MRDLLPSWAHLSCTQRETKRGEVSVSSLGAGENKQRRRCGVASLGLAATGDGGGRAGWLHGCEAHPFMLAVWAEVARGLLAMDAGG
jgi:hypothetical protein